MLKRKTAGILILILACSMGVYLINKGFQHVLPQSMLRYAGQNWNDGQYTEAIRWFANANASAWNAGARWTIAEYYLRQMKEFSEKGELAKALENCSQAVKVLAGHDDEGAVSYNCIVIEEKIKSQK
jgi:hypothetical protein